MSLSKVNRVKKSHNINLGKLVGQIPDLKSQDKFLQVEGNTLLIEGLNINEK